MQEDEQLTWKCKCGRVNVYTEQFQPEEATDEGILSSYWFVQCDACGEKELI
jgi:hypothetical protein